jgi:hypothetical protein
MAGLYGGATGGASDQEPPGVRRDLARRRGIGYNGLAMEAERRRLWIMVGVTVVAVVAGALILKGALPGGGESPLATPAGNQSPLPGPGESPLSTPGSSDGASWLLWPGAAAALLWVALGIVLALLLAALIRRLLRPSG